MFAPMIHAAAAMQVSVASIAPMIMRVRLVRVRRRLRSVARMIRAPTVRMTSPGCRFPWGNRSFISRPTIERTSCSTVRVLVGWVVIARPSRMIVIESVMRNSSSSLWVI